MLSGGRQSRTTLEHPAYTKTCFNMFSCRREAPARCASADLASQQAVVRQHVPRADLSLSCLNLGFSYLGVNMELSELQAAFVRTDVDVCVHRILGVCSRRNGRDAERHLHVFSLVQEIVELHDTHRNKPKHNVLKFVVRIS